jgi:hypothetical protein
MRQAAILVGSAGRGVDVYQSADRRGEIGGGARIPIKDFHQDSGDPPEAVPASSVRTDAIPEPKFWLTACLSMKDFCLLRPRSDGRTRPDHAAAKMGEASWAKLKGTGSHTIMASGPTT